VAVQSVARRKLPKSQGCCLRRLPTPGHRAQRVASATAPQLRSLLSTLAATSRWHTGQAHQCWGTICSSLGFIEHLSAKLQADDLEPSVRQAASLGLEQGLLALGALRHSGIVAVGLEFTFSPAASAALSGLLDRSLQDLASVARTAAW
jgi:hypothetical protein